jgi:hypothetical protein
VSHSSHPPGPNSDYVTQAHPEDSDLIPQTHPSSILDSIAQVCSEQILFNLTETEFAELVVMGA